MANIVFPLPKFEIKSVGRWDKARNLPKIIRDCMSGGYEEAATYFASRYLRNLINFIGSGRSPKSVYYRHLTVLYMNFGYGPKQHIKPRPFYFRTGVLKRSFGIKRNKKGNIVVGLTRPYSRSSAGGATLATILRVLEEGGEWEAWRGIQIDIPPRPLIKPLFDEMGGTETLRRVIVREIAKRFRIRGIKANLSW